MIQDTCFMCRKIYLKYPSRIKQRFCSKQCANLGQIGKKKNIGRNNGNWKGDSVGYTSLHIWVRNNKPIPKSCEECGEIKRLDASNISGKYKRIMKDWKYLCRKCHMKQDGRTSIRNLQC